MSLKIKLKEGDRILRSLRDSKTVNSFREGEGFRDLIGENFIDLVNYTFPTSESEKHSILKYVLNEGQMSHLQVLIDLGLDFGQINHSGVALMNFLTSNQSADAAKMAEYIYNNVSGPINFNGVIEQDLSLFSYACHFGRVELVEFMIRHGANVNQKCRMTGDTPMILASCGPDQSPESQYKKLKLLLEHGADPNIANKDGNTPVFSLVEQGNLNALKLLHAHGADINHKRVDEAFPYNLACQADRYLVVDYLQHHDAEVNPQFSCWHGRTTPFNASEPIFSDSEALSHEYVLYFPLMDQELSKERVDAILSLHENADWFYRASGLFNVRFKIGNLVPEHQEFKSECLAMYFTSPYRYDRDRRTPGYEFDNRLRRSLDMMLTGHFAPVELLYCNAVTLIDKTNNAKWLIEDYFYDEQHSNLFTEDYKSIDFLPISDDIVPGTVEEHYSNFFRIKNLAYSQKWLAGRGAAMRQKIRERRHNDLRQIIKSLIFS